MTESGKRRLRLIQMVLTMAVALIAALSMVGRVRLVDVLILFFGGFAADASLVGYIRQRVRERRGPANSTADR